MKKTLITLAALSMASVASALVPGNAGVENEVTVTQSTEEGVWLPNGEYDIRVDGDASLSAGNINGYNGGYTDPTYNKVGTGTLTVSGYTYNKVENVNVKEGTLKIDYAGYIADGKVTVSGGATLELAKATVYGDGGTKALELKDGATISGDGSLALHGGVISASGTGNVVSVDMKRDYNVNMNVDANGELTFSGDLDDDNATATVYFVKTGAGKLTIENETINSAFTMSHEGGTLDLSDVTSMGALELKNNTTLILGQAITATSLTLGSGVTIDVSSWSGSPEEIFTGLTSLSATSPVTVLFADGVTKEMTLTSVGGTVAVPEPATATLSLLALAGLAARRRRK